MESSPLSLKLESIDMSIHIISSKSVVMSCLLLGLESVVWANNRGIQLLVPGEDTISMHSGLFTTFKWSYFGWYLISVFFGPEQH